MKSKHEYEWNASNHAPLYWGPCVGWVAPDTQRQMTAPQFPDLDHMLVEYPDGNQGGLRGTVDMAKYKEWLSQTLGLEINVPEDISL